MGKRKPLEEPEERTFEVTVWNMMDGDIVKKAWSATQAEVDEIEEYYGDEPLYSVQIEER